MVKVGGVIITVASCKTYHHLVSHKSVHIYIYRSISQNCYKLCVMCCVVFISNSPGPDNPVPRRMTGLYM